jgi:Domain of unknown function (DUF1899)
MLGFRQSKFKHVYGQGMKKVSLAIRSTFPAFELRRMSRNSAMTMSELRRMVCFPQYQEDRLFLITIAWDSNLIKVNPLYLSVNWDSAGMYILNSRLTRFRGWCVRCNPLRRARKASRFDTVIQRTFRTCSRYRL